MLWSGSLSVKRKPGTQLCLVFCIVALLAPVSAFACRYNVRETGFVDTGTGWPYVVVCYVDAQTPRSFGDAFLREAEAVLSESNVTYELVDVGYHPDHPAMEYLNDIERSRFPILLLVSSEGSTIPLSIQPTAADPGRALRTALQQVVSTPFRDEVVREVAQHYGAVLFVEGLDPVQNQRAQQAVQTAVDMIQSEVKFMPKPITHAPTLIKLEAGARSDEKVLLWALGVTEDLDSGPYAAVLYGKARWLGPLLQNSEIDERRLFYLLAIIGADCECGLDPGLIRGRPLPLRWDRSLHAEVAEDLGFDPENPMVRIEVGQIMRMRASLYPDGLPNRSSTMEDDLPVPFVRDGVPPRSASFSENPVMTTVFYSLVGIGGLVVVIGLIIIGMAQRRDS